MKTPLKRRTAACLFALAALSTTPYAEESPAPPPAYVQQTLQGARLSGEGQLRFLGLRVYDARLWVVPQFQASQFASHPLALELTYHRAFSGAAIAQRSIKEIERQGKFTPAQLEHWRQALTALIPDVEPGDRLTGLYQPGQGMQLLRSDRELGSIEDAELARLFFGIWLSQHTSEPALRDALLTHASVATP